MLTASTSGVTGYPTPTLTYQWEASADGSTFTAIAGATGSTYTPGAAQVGLQVRVVATADDGCVEALEHEAGTLLAVQWHPEDLHASSPSDAALFADLVERAGSRAFASTTKSTGGR